MTTHVVTPAAPAGPVQRALLAVAAVAGLLLLFAVLAEGGAVSALGGSEVAQGLHELFHDSRHLLGVPCH